jgi:hypothetical protein
VRQPGSTSEVPKETLYETPFSNPSICNPTIQLDLNQTFQFRVLAESVPPDYIKIPNQTVTWGFVGPAGGTFSSSQTVTDADGMSVNNFTAGDVPGYYTIQAKILNQFNTPYIAQFSMNISAALGSIVVMPDNSSIETGLTQQFTATGIFSDGSTQDLTTDVSWSSSDIAVASISDVAISKGLAAAISAGTTQISANLGTIRGAAMLTVSDAAPESCAPGTYDNGSGCVAAAPGYYVPASGATEQTPCTLGKYQPNAGAVSCILADAGHYVDVTAAAMQIGCLPGSYQPNSGATSCILASPNYYGQASAAIQQIQCPVGYTSEAGAAECTQILDTTAPTITLSTPANGATYPLNQSIIANYACQDESGGSGLASCLGTVPNGSPINTSSVGAKSFAVNAADNALNPNNAAVSYNVVYNFSGFSSPVDSAPTVNVAKAGQDVPLKWRVTDASGLPVTNLSNVSVIVVSVSCSLGSTTDALEEYASGNSGLQNLGNGYYQFNWSTPKTYANSCKTLKLDLSEGPGLEHTALFKFTK